MIELKGCGRIDDHTPHPWWSRWTSEGFGRASRRQFWCKGHFLTEGGSRRGTR